MKKWLDNSSKTWLIVVALLIGLSGLSSPSPSLSVTSSKQTEVTVRPSSVEATHLFSFTYSNQIAGYSGDLCFKTRIRTDSQCALVKLKNNKPKTFSRSSALGLSHLKKLNKKEDTDLPRS